MAIKKTIILDADTRQAQAAVKDLTVDVKKLDQSLEDVEGQSKKASESIDEVAGNGGAIAILDQLTGGLATRFKDAFEATKLFNFSLKGTRTALIATGIGAFVVAVGLLVAYWDDISDAITGANKELERQNTLINKNIALLGLELTKLEAQEKLLIAQGESIEAIKDDKIITLKLQILENIELQKNLKLQLEIEKSVAAEKGFLEETGSAFVNFFAGRRAQANFDEKARLKRFKDVEELTTSLGNAETAAANLQLALFEATRPTEGGGGKATTERKKEEQQSVFDEEAQLIKDSNATKLDLLTTYGTEKLQYEQDLADGAIAIAKYEAEAKIQAVEGYAGALSQLSNAIGQETSAGKALAVASTLINTYAAITAQLRASSTSPGAAIPGYAIAQAIATGIFGLAQVKKIISVKVPNGGGSGGNVPTASEAVASVAPNVNIVGQSTGNQIADSLAQNPVKAFVVTKDVTTGQELDRNKVDTATF